MKYLKPLFLCLFLMSFINKPQNKKTKCQDSISIVKIPSGMSTISGIDCAQFDREFTSMKDTIYITSIVLKKKIIQAINSAKPYPEANNQIDTRGKIFIKYWNGKCDTICLGTTPIILRGGKSMILENDEIGIIINNISLW